MSLVVFERPPSAEYERDCVSLPRDYGSPRWEERAEVQAIRKAVFAALDKLEARSGIGARLRGRRVLVKPNLVIVYDRIGTRERSYPETTDPRVLDALVLWLSGRAAAAAVDIVESSGRGSPTRASFAIAGIDRLARRRGCGLLALEEEPVDRYLLPKARIQREILVPRPFSAVVRGEAAYVSVPKLKTNLYTGVTLGFKNAMGVIPYNLRQRDHDRNIERKLVEMLYLFKPDLVLIDGVVGGEGECPAPVFPVDSRAVIAGDHAVETDRAATRFMGFDPDEIGLMRIADELGFGDPEGAEILGDASPVPFRPADASLLSERARSIFPGLTVLYGLPGAGRDPRAMEARCRGGCVASARFGLAMLEAEGARLSRPALLALGPGIEEGSGSGARRLWFDRDGKAWDEAAIAAFPGPSGALGSCSRPLAPSVDRLVEGCMPLANAPHALLHALSGTRCALLGLRNRRLALLARSLFRMRAARRALIGRGERLDVDFPLAGPDERGPSPAAAGSATPGFAEPAGPPGADFLPWPLPPLEAAEIPRALALEDELALSSFTGRLEFGLARRAAWAALGLLTTLLTLAPFGLAASSALRGKDTGPWLILGAGLLTFHILELPWALREAPDSGPGARRAPGSRRRLAGYLLLCVLGGFPWWLPRRLSRLGRFAFRRADA